MCVFVFLQKRIKDKLKQSGTASIHASAASKGLWGRFLMKRKLKGKRNAEKYAI